MLDGRCSGCSRCPSTLGRTYSDSRRRSCPSRFPKRRGRTLAGAHHREGLRPDQREVPRERSSPIGPSPRAGADPGGASGSGPRGGELGALEACTHRAPCTQSGCTRNRKLSNYSGADQDRTGDLLNAIQALSQAELRPRDPVEGLVPRGPERWTFGLRAISSSSPLSSAGTPSRRLLLPEGSRRSPSPGWKCPRPPFVSLRSSP